MKLWKRNAVVAAVVLFVCMAVYLNWSYAQNGEVSADVGKTLGEAALVGGSESGDPVLTGGNVTLGEKVSLQNDYFASARLNRCKARDAALDLLNRAAQEEGADESVRNKANETMQTMADLTVCEAQIENLVTAKGSTDCVAFIVDHSISVVVGPVEGGLTTADTAKIMDIVTGETDFTAGQIKIIEAQGQKNN